MHLHRFSMWICRTFVVVAILCVMTLAAAGQTTASNASNAPAQNGKSNAAVKDPLTCKYGQRRCATNKHRWAAAARTADRRARNQAKHQGEVK